MGQLRSPELIRLIKERNKFIVKMYECLVSVPKIGKVFGLTSERVSQILEKQGVEIQRGVNSFVPPGRYTYDVIKEMNPLTILSLIADRGITRDELITKYKLPGSRISIIFKLAGVISESGRGHLPTHKWDKHLPRIKELIENGAHLVDIAKEFNTSPQNIRRVVTTYIDKAINNIRKVPQQLGVASVWPSRLDEIKDLIRKNPKIRIIDLANHFKVLYATVWRVFTQYFKTNFTQLKKEVLDEQSKND